jgi:hypothetical protein
MDAPAAFADALLELIAARPVGNTTQWGRKTWMPGT